MIRVLIILALIVWIGSAAYRAYRKAAGRDTLRPKPRLILPSRPRAAITQVVQHNTKWATRVEIAPRDLLDVPDFDDWSAVSCVGRPDGQYALAIMQPDDPDFPGLWVIDKGNNRLIKLPAADLIDWPGTAVLWPEDDLSPLVFDSILGYSQVDIDLENETFAMKQIVRDTADVAAEQWFIRSDTDNGVNWFRLRRFRDNSAQTYYPCLRTTANAAGTDYPHAHSHLRYSYFLEYDEAVESLLDYCIPVILDDSGNPAIEPSVQANSDAAAQINSLLTTGKIQFPDGNSEAEIGEKLFQAV